MRFSSEAHNTDWRGKKNDVPALAPKADAMMQFLAVAVMLGCIGRCLWVRRDSISDPSWWESAFVAAVILQGLGALLTLPQAAQWLDHFLHSFTGVWELEEWMGHMCYMGSVAALVLHALIKLKSLDEIRADCRRNVQLPITFALPVTLFLMYHSHQTDNELEHGLINADTDYWLNAYWLLYCGTMTYLLIYAARLFLQIRVDQRSRRCANSFLICIGFGVTACVFRMATVFSNHEWDIYAAQGMWFGTVIATSLMTLAATRSWQNKVKYFMTESPSPSNKQMHE